MNLHDIAREANVSIATVSRVINHSSLVTKETREKVQAIIDKNAYTPNALARGLIQNATKTIGVLTIDIRSPYFSTVVYNLEGELRALGYNIFLCNTSGELEEKIRYIQILLERKVDALIFIGSVYHEKKGNRHIINAGHKVPILLLNNHIHAPNTYCILCDDRKGTYDATKYLLTQGRKNILYIHSLSTFSGLNKKKGYLKAVKEVEGLEPRVVYSVNGYKEMVEKLRQEFSSAPFDAVVASDDIYANIAVSAMNQMGIKVPDQIAVIGYNNSSICNYTYPTLSTVDSRMEDLSKNGAILIDRILRGEKVEEIVQILDPRLVIRETC